jgi:hypothetical protein
MAAARKSAARKTATRKPTSKTARRRPARTAALGRSATSSSNRWSHEVTGHSDALDLKGGVFKLTSAKKIAASLKQSAERSSRRKTGTTVRRCRC